MSGYLVVFRADLDDLPLLLTADRAEAHEFAQSVTGVDDPRVRAVCELYQLDTSTENGVAVVSFVAGRPTDVHLVKDFDGQDPLPTA